MLRLLACAAALLPLAPPDSSPEGASIPCEWSGVERIVAVGDVHGAYDRFVEILKAAELVDPDLHWKAGKTHLVQTGDIPDRGPSPRKAFDLLIRIEKEALEAGGRVHALIGNHEGMMVQGDYRYVHPADLRAYVTRESPERRAEFLRANPRLSGRDVPLGWVEHRAAFSPRGRYGAWITGHNAVIKVNDTLFVHGGLSDRFAAVELARLNDSIRAELRQTPGREALYPPLYPLVNDPRGPLWYRGFATEREAELEPLVRKLLEFHRAARLVVAHSVTGGRIERRSDGKVFLIDCGMNPLYPGGRPAALEIIGEKTREIYAREKGNP
jgi:hypothetical protein